MPQAWLARFGRTVASQAVDAIGARMEGGRETHVTVGGFALPIGKSGAQDADIEEALARSLDDEMAGTTRSMTGQALLRSSTFQLSGGGSAGGPAWTAWGQVATSGFEADVDDVRMDATVTGGARRPNASISASCRRPRSFRKSSRSPCGRMPWQPRLGGASGRPCAGRRPPSRSRSAGSRSTTLRSRLADGQPRLQPGGKTTPQTRERDALPRTVRAGRNRGQITQESRSSAPGIAVKCAGIRSPEPSRAPGSVMRPDILRLSDSSVGAHPVQICLA